MRHNEYDQYDHSRARGLGLALGFLMNYDELRWTLEFKSRSFPYRRTARRLRWKECRPGAWDSEQWLSPHRITSTYRHIDISTYRHGMSQGLLSFAKNYHIWYMMWFLFRHVPIQELSHFMLNLFRFVLFRNHHIWCDFFSVIFLFRNLHIWCDSCSEIVIFRNFHISCIFFQICSVSGRIAFDMIFFSFQVTLETGAAAGDFLFSGLDFFLMT